VVASARNAETHPELLKLKESYTDYLSLLDCDVTQTQNLPIQCDQAWSFFDGLDSWIYNVGTYHPMRLAQWDLAQFDLMTQTNYSGAVHLMHALLPKFQQEQPQHPSSETPTDIQKNQWLLNVSLASDFGLPYGGGYSAPKAALMNLAESLQPELAEAGIQLKVVNHGFVKTRLTAKNDFAMLGLMEPEDAARKIIQSLKNTQFESRFPFNLAFVLGTIKRLPKSWAMAITKRMLTDV
jgi:short-subunit dehydrogenase